jgi:hypothetical protein
MTLEIAEIMWRRWLMKQYAFSSGGMTVTKDRTELFGETPVSVPLPTRYPTCNVVTWKPGKCDDRRAINRLWHGTTLNCYSCHLLLLLLLSSSSSSSSHIFFIFSERAIQFVYRPPSASPSHLHTWTFNRFTNQPQTALDMEQVLHTRHD